MATKLTEITTQYHTFIDNQVLTKDQLNEFINYFEDQDRMSRVFLSGVGIVCGFNLKIDVSKPSVTITQGTGITTDGDLLKLKKNIIGSSLKSIDLEDIEYSWVKKFEDNFANYRFFKRLIPGGGKLKEIPIDLWEILPAKTENAKTLSSLANWDKMVVLLYLESYAKEGDLCTAIDCDNQGVEQIARLRVLLVSKTDADIILGLDSVFLEHNKINEIDNLPEVAVRRVFLNQVNSVNYDEVKKAYYTALINDSLFTNLSNGIKKIVQEFKSVLQLNISDLSLNIYLNQLKNILVLNAGNIPFNVQYRYDCVKDIVDTYNEIKTLLFSLNEICNPDITAFAKHLMLGSLDEINSEIQNYRHRFYKSAAINCGKNSIQHCRSLVLRLFQLIVHFKTTVGEVKITPSNKLPELSFRSIPFYYDLKPELLKTWNFFKTEKLKYDTNLCYHKTLLSSSPQIQEPLNFNTDNFDFYRIEGHQGKDYKTVLDEIDDLKIKYGLPFHVKALSVNVNQETLDIDDYECEFEDLNVLLKAWTAEQNCILAQVSQFFSGFSIDEPGSNVKESAIAVKEPVRNILNIDSRNESVYSRTISDSIESVKTQTSGESRLITYSKSNVVLENLVTDENALGSSMKKAIDETLGGSVNDIIAKAGSIVAEKINTSAWNEMPEVKTLVIDNSIELMAYSHVLSQKMPGLLTDVSAVSINEYKITLKELCALVEKLKKIYQTVELSVALKALMTVLITQLSSICCSAKKLEVLLEEINKRKENIIVRLKLSKFVEKTPGLEHKAGVEPGGTFFLIYLNKTQTEIKETEGKNDLLEKTTDNYFASRSLSGESVINANVTNRTGRDTILNDKTERSLKTDLLNRAARITDLPNNTVVADFSLPYLCCSECSPINFIVEKQAVSLRVNRDYYCLGKDTEPLIFNVSPVDGVIKANPVVEGMKIDGTKLLFDATEFPDEMLGNTIRFTVNEQITTCEVTVSRAVTFDYKVPELPTSETEFTFVPTGNLDGATFLWSFGDDNLSTERNPTHKYILPVNDENKVTVSLTVTAPNGVCQTTVEHDISFKTEETKISLSEANFCEKDTNSYPFKVTPPGASAKIEGSGVKPDNSGGFIFIPANAGVGNFEFLLNGSPSGIKVMVFKTPVADFKAEQIENQLIITNNSTNAKSFVWLINGEKLEREDTSPIIIDLSPNSTNEWKLQIRALSEYCGANTSEEAVIITKFIVEPVVDNCVEETKASVLSDLKILVKSDLPNSELVHSIWMKTCTLYGGTAEYKKGVLDDLDNFISGRNNNKLTVLFEKIWNETVKNILTINRNRNRAEYNRLIELFGLQLQLFYHILGCQNAERITEFGDRLEQLLDIIIVLLQRLKNGEVIFSNTFRKFIIKYSKKVNEIEILKNHFSFIKNENLI